MPFKNFRIWRGRLPHWRADDVRYYVTFRHRREIDFGERRLLLRALLKPEARKWDLLILCVLPEQTELIFTVREQPTGRPYELSEIVEKAKTKAGRDILKKTGERYPPFYAESYDRIIRDEAELEERWQAILDSPINHELAETAEEWDGLWLPVEV
ncbi:MAG TPA: hypothetical protein VHE55_16485 [Fimbriimonadaceae bacterium]|nr:hypothetical protein [Fimbriimonadaceae bacterium]